VSEEDATMMRSGYDPSDNICWQFNNKGDRSWRCKCPAHTGEMGRRGRYFVFGRCRSGRRWFWSAQKDFGEEWSAHGWEDTEAAAVASAMAAVRVAAAGELAMAHVRHGWATGTLKDLNGAKRLQRPPPDTSDARPVQYLFGSWFGGEVECRLHLYRFRITKCTAKRIYYLRRSESIDEHGEPIDHRHIRDTTFAEIGFVDRQKLEAEGHAYNRGRHWSASDWHLYASLEALLADHGRNREPETPPDDLRRLKAEMAAAHPDRGGSSQEFIAARARYVTARRAMRV
jgi:hypothetical protein